MGVIYNEGHFRSSIQKVKIVNTSDIPSSSGKLSIENEILVVEDRSNYKDEILSID